MLQVGRTIKWNEVKDIWRIEKVLPFHQTGLFDEVFSIKARIRQISDD